MKKKYNVYGIGHALVDIEIEVNEQFLKVHGLEKGLMSIIDKDRYHFLLKSIAKEKKNISSGGSAGNTIVGISQLGGKTYYSGKVGDDDLGEFYYKDFIKNNVDTNIYDQREVGITGQSLIFITPDGDRTMNTLIGIGETFSEDQIDWIAMKNSEYLYIEGYLASSSTGRTAAIEARIFAQKNNIKVAMTLSDPGIIEYFKDELDKIKGKEKLDLLFCNEEEAFKFTNTDNLKQSAEMMKNIAHTFVITRGADGAYLFDGNKEYFLEGRQLDPLNSNGAGDLFAGAFLWGILHDLSWRRSGELACLASSELVMVFSARLDKSQMEAIKKQIVGL